MAAGMALLLHGSPICSTSSRWEASSLVCGVPSHPQLPCKTRMGQNLYPGGVSPKSLLGVSFLRKGFKNKMPDRVITAIPRSSSPSNSNGRTDSSSDQAKTPFGYTRKDVLLIGIGVTLLGVGLKSGLEFIGVDPLQAGNAVQLIIVLGLTVGWISTYIFRVSNKEMTYAQQLRDYESKVMEKRLQSLSEAELEALLEQVEEEKRGLSSGEQIS